MSTPFALPNRQFDSGTFEVRMTNRSNNSTSVVGWLHVVDGTGMKIEHWVFVNDYASPTGDHQVEVQRLATSYSSLTAFLSAMEAQQPSASPYKYARCECIYYATLPD